MTNISTKKVINVQYSVDNFLKLCYYKREKNIAHIIPKIWFGSIYQVADNCLTMGDYMAQIAIILGCKLLKSFNFVKRHMVHSGLVYHVFFIYIY